jgi:hypothetical protein
MGIAVAKAKKKTGPKPNPEGPRDALIAIKCFAAYKSWAEEFAEAERTTPSQLFDIAVMEWAKARGFRPPPKR